MSAGPPRWTWRSMSSTACWSWDARATSASPNLDGAGVLAPTPLIRATHLRGQHGHTAVGQEPGAAVVADTAGPLECAMRRDIEDRVAVDHEDDWMPRCLGAALCALWCHEGL